MTVNNDGKARQRQQVKQTMRKAECCFCVWTHRSDSSLCAQQTEKMFPQKQSSTATHPLWTDGFVYIQAHLPPPPGSLPLFVSKPPCTRPPTCSVEALLSQPHTSIETSTPSTEAREWHVWMPGHAHIAVCARAAEERGGATCTSQLLWFVGEVAALSWKSVADPEAPECPQSCCVCHNQSPSPNTAVNAVDYASELQNKAEDPQFQQTNSS